jgi:hypothetical protein
MRFLFLAPALAVLGVGASVRDVSLKCGGLTAPGGKPLISIDGVITSQDYVSSIKARAEDIYRIDIVCMNPTDSTFNRTHGWGVVSIWTKQGPAPRVEQALDVIREAQDAYFAKQGRYLAALDDIRFPENMKTVRVTMDVDKTGWIARTTLPRLLRTCTMFDGTMAAPLPNEPRKPVCVSNP